jgi:deoxyribose-phosphate aldolase
MYYLELLIIISKTLRGKTFMDIENIIVNITQEIMQRLENNKVNPNINLKYPGQDVASAIEHSILQPGIKEFQVIDACKEAIEYRFANVCVLPYFVSLASELLRGSGILVCTVVAFPHGTIPTETKLFEAKDAMDRGAQELDVGVNISAIKSGKLKEASKDLEKIISISRGRAKVKAIYEQGLYSAEEKIEVLNIIRESGADFIKIQNFLTGKKAIPEDVSFVRLIVGESMGIKIDGGVSDVETLRELLVSGANRVGCSKSVKIVRGY